MIVVYGVINSEGTHTDVSNTLKGAKNYATRNKYIKVSKRVGYNAYEVAQKINNNWINL